MNTLSAILTASALPTTAAGKRASYTELAYAGQTYNNAPDRIVLVQWLRTQNPERLYTGMLTLPRELELTKQDGEWFLHSILFMNGLCKKSSEHTLPRS